MKRNVLIPGTLGQLAQRAASALELQNMQPVVLDRVTSDDIDTGLANIDNDVCIATIAVVGQYLRYLEEHGSAEVFGVLAPELCRDCRSVSVPGMLHVALERAGYTDIELVPLTSTDVAKLFPTPHAADATPTKPVIGVCGNMPVLTTEIFRFVVCEHLEKSGCKVMLAPMQAIADKRDFLTPALEFFEGQGITTVICILPFGCLGGHVFARGQLRKLQQRFAGIEVSMLDYDPSASDINLVNRTELIIQSAREKATETTYPTLQPADA